MASRRRGPRLLRKRNGVTWIQMWSKRFVPIPGTRRFLSLSVQSLEWFEFAVRPSASSTTPHASLFNFITTSDNSNIFSAIF